MPKDIIKIGTPTLVIVAALAVSAIAAPLSAFAAISQQTSDTSCTNQGGNQPGGQQPSCSGSGLTQQTTTTNVNPAGSAPPGQNK
jgi:hypothetical protein